MIIQSKKINLENAKCKVSTPGSRGRKTAQPGKLSETPSKFTIKSGLEIQLAVKVLHKVGARSGHSAPTVTTTTTTTDSQDPQQKQL